jgi:hypothetical protein
MGPFNELYKMSLEGEPEVEEGWTEMLFYGWNFNVIGNGNCDDDVNEIDLNYSTESAHRCAYDCAKRGYWMSTWRVYLGACLCEKNNKYSTECDKYFG